MQRQQAQLDVAGEVDGSPKLREGDGGRVGGSIVPCAGADGSPSRRRSGASRSRSRGRRPPDVDCVRERGGPAFLRSAANCTAHGVCVPPRGSSRPARPPSQPRASCAAREVGRSRRERGQAWRSDDRQRRRRRVLRAQVSDRARRDGAARYRELAQRAWRASLPGFERCARRAWVARGPTGAAEPIGERRRAGGRQESARRAQPGHWRGGGTERGGADLVLLRTLPLLG